MADISAFSTKSTAKKASPNVSGGWLVMVLAGIIAAVIFIVITSRGNATESVVVATRDINPGDRIGATDFALAKVAVQPQQLGQMVTFGNREAYVGEIAVAPVAQGDIVSKSAIQPQAANAGMRSMTIPVDKAHANNGDIRSGDRIDIVNEGKDNNTAATFAATDLEVTSTSTSNSTSIAATNGNFLITVAVSSDQSLAIATTLKEGKMDIVRSTGATPIAGGAAVANANNAGANNAGANNAGANNAAAPNNAAQ